MFIDFSKAFNSLHRGKMEEIPLSYGLLKETVSVIMMLYKNIKAMVHSSDGDTKFFNIIAEVLQEDILTPYLFIICRDYVLQTSILKKMVSH